MMADNTPREKSRSPSRLPALLLARAQEEKAQRAAVAAAAAAAATTTQAAPSAPDSRWRWNPLAEFSPQLQAGRSYQQSLFAVTSHGMETPTGSDTFSTDLRTSLGHPRDNQENRRILPPSQWQDQVGDYLLKAIEYVNKAHAILRPTSAEAANRLAKVSNDISTIYGDFLASEPTSPNPDHFTPAQTPTPAYPPGLYRSLNEAQAAAANSSCAVSPLHTLASPSVRFPSPPSALTSLPTQAASHTTWARIAATKPAQQDSPSPSPPPPSQFLPRKPTPITATTKLRVIHVHNLPPSSTLSTLTEPIKVGPLLSISLTAATPFRTGTLIFQHSAHAAEFLDLNESSVTYTKASLYGAGIDVVAGGGWPQDADTIAMSERGGKERRRLTFVGAGIFARVPREVFRQDVTNIAGKDGIEYVWLFNTGNATVVCASVRIARAVKQAFMAKVTKGGMYAGLGVQFSADPCEKELRLVTQMLQGPETTTNAVARRK